MRWANVDLDEGILRIEESAVVVSGRTIIGPPKSAAGRRIVTIDQGTVELLRAHRAAQAETRGRIGSQITTSADQDWVFASPDGSQLNGAYVSRDIDKLVADPRARAGGQLASQSWLFRIVRVRSERSSGGTSASSTRL